MEGDAESRSKCLKSAVYEDNYDVKFEREAAAFAIARSNVSPVYKITSSDFSAAYIRHRKLQ